MNFNLRIHEQPEGYSVVIVFEPEATEEKAIKQADWIAEQLLDVGWEASKVQ